MRIRPDRLGLLSAIAVIVLAVISDQLETPNDIGESPPRRPVISDPTTPAPRGREFTVVIEEKRDSSGTAFSLGNGWWMTARHVVDGCDAVGIRTTERRGQRARETRVHPNADVALMRIDRSAEAVAFATRTPSVGDDAFHIGYPRGEPGALHSRFIGSRVMRVTGRYRTREPVLAWAEIARIPESDEPLSGLSGGPVFDADGRLVGVHVAGSVRRGRSFTATLDSVHELLGARSLDSPSGSAVRSLSPTSLPKVADALRADLTVALALCDVR